MEPPPPPWQSAVIRFAPDGGWRAQIVSRDEYRHARSTLRAFSRRRLESREFRAGSFESLLAKLVAHQRETCAEAIADHRYDEAAAWVIIESDCVRPAFFRLRYAPGNNPGYPVLEAVNDASVTTDGDVIMVLIRDGVLEAGTVGELADRCDIPFGPRCPALPLPQVDARLISPDDAPRLSREALRPDFLNSSEYELLRIVIAATLASSHTC